MKHQTFRIITQLSLFVIVAATSAYAQATSRLQANIPFDFIVGSKTLAAGTYTVQKIQRQTSQGIVLFRRVNGGGNMLVRMLPAQAELDQDETQLIFNRYGDRYFLSRIVSSSDDTLELPRSRIERVLERDLAKSRAQRRAVALMSVKR